MGHLGTINPVDAGSKRVSVASPCCNRQVAVAAPRRAPLHPPPRPHGLSKYSRDKSQTQQEASQPILVGESGSGVDHNILEPI